MEIREEKDPAIDFLEDMMDEIDYALIGPRDNRIHEIRTREFPFNTICHLGRDFGNGLWKGCTGTLISPCIILTAGHCIYSHKRRKAPERIRVTPGRADRDIMPYGSIISKEYYVPEQYYNARNSRNPDRRNFDYGIIILPSPFRGIKRFMRIWSLPNDKLNRLKNEGFITIGGYPGDKPIGTLWLHSERLKRIKPRRLFYTVDTCPGHSGSPVWIKDRQGKDCIIIGIHSSGIVDELGRTYGCSKGTILAPPGLMNSGVRITPHVLANITNPKRVVDGRRTMVKLP